MGFREVSVLVFEIQRGFEIPGQQAPLTTFGSFTADKKDDSSKVDETATMPGTETEEPPTTYNIKEKYHYFKPRVEVETEEEGNKSHIKEIFIRGEVNISGYKFFVEC